MTTTMHNLSTKLHRDGSCTYWSTHEQRWVRTDMLPPDREMAAMGERDRMRIALHIAASHGDGAEEAQAWLDGWREARL